MPMYEIYHVTALTPAQQDELAEEITRIHSRTFTTPSLFVNVRFIECVEESYYVAGKKTRINRIVATVRHGPSRSRSDYASIESQIQKVWMRVVAHVDLDDKEKDGSFRPDTAKKMEKLQPHLTLSTTFFLGSLVAAVEKGISVPEPGQDREWLRENLELFKSKAAAGDDQFRDMLEELREREDLKGILPEEEMQKGEKKTEKKREEGDGPSHPDDEQSQQAARLAGDDHAAQQHRDSKLEDAKDKVEGETGASDAQQPGENMPHRSKDNVTGAVE